MDEPDFLSQLDRLTAVTRLEDHQQFFGGGGGILKLRVK